MDKHQTVMFAIMCVQLMATPCIIADEYDNEIAGENPLAHLEGEFGDGFLNTETFTRVAIDAMDS